MSTHGLGARTMADVEAGRLVAEASARAAVLVHQGGDCDVPVDPRSHTRFDVMLTDGRMFRGCALHGDGGKLRGSGALRRAELRAFNAWHRKGGGGYRRVRIYLVSRWFGDECLTVEPEDIAAIVLSE